MFVLGLTGGIGSGKTAVSDRFETYGIDVIDADLCSRVVVEKGRPALTQIAEHFGSDILLPSGELDRAELRTRIFADPNEKQWLESLLHPLIGEEVFNQICAAKSPYAILASPLLVESGQNAICDSVVVVDVPEALQIERTCKRDENDEAQVKRIMASQASREDRLKHADNVIENTAGLDHLDHEVERLHAIYLEKAAEKSVAS
ncbi:Dephospho-CoA kinase [BD1-7 clade bacterium]|uniref:Dephospho-CoA kinase n=1 Tax=BD1-7 clade bacterium TaxID=2029982 RepID=A0A5S9N7C6_9GAMM|nr:Dephospho-CoA kinase [BD1-7 clade bacterium]